MDRFSILMNRHGDQVEFARVRVVPALVATGAWHVPSFSGSADTGLSTTCGMAIKPPTRLLGIST